MGKLLIKAGEALVAFGKKCKCIWNGWMIALTFNVGKECPNSICTCKS